MNYCSKEVTTVFHTRSQRDHAQRIAVFLLLAVSACYGQDAENCLYCHQFSGLSRLDAESGRVHWFQIDPEYIDHQRGPHAGLRCTDCHEAEAARVVPHGAFKPVDCTRTCHLGGSSDVERRFSHANIPPMLAGSAHTPETLAAVEFEGGPLLLPGQSQCLFCHDEPVFRTPERAVLSTEANVRRFDRCDVCHVSQLPVDTQYFLKHVASRLEPARPPLEQAQVCAVCHSDAKVMAQHELSNSVASFVRSFHGKAALLGQFDTASCVDCHVAIGDNAHRMLGSHEPLSAVHPTRVADSCRTIACHPGTDPGFSAASVHLDIPRVGGSPEFWLACAFLALTVLSFGPSCIIVLLELVQLVLGRHSHASRELVELARRVVEHPQGRARLRRFDLISRVQHWVLTLLFTLLCLTGFPMKFAEQAWAESMVGWFGGLATARLIHHWSGIALLIGFAAHLAHIMAGVFEKARRRRPDGKPVGLWTAFLQLPLVVSPAEAGRALQLLAYLVGLRRTRPMFGRFSLTEKFEYFGVLWGTTLLGITGLMLWKEEWFSHWFGGRMFNIALIAHTYEAFLAVIHVGILHIYNVLLNPAVFPLSLATLTGHTPLTKLAEENGEFLLETARELDLVPQEPLCE